MNQCCTQINQLPFVQHIEGASFDRFFTLADSSNEPYVFSPGSVATFVLRSRLDTIIATFTADIQAEPGQVRLRLSAAATVGKAGRFVWSGVVEDGGAIVAMAANEFHVLEGVPGSTAIDPIPIIPPNPVPGGTSDFYESLPQSQYPTWTLVNIPALPSTSRFYINGLKQEFGMDYVISGRVLTYLGEPVNYSATIEAYYQ